jgi:predicted RNase H-like nuclease (RuvC/YqgF family)
LELKELKLKVLEYTVNERRIEINNLNAQVESEKKQTEVLERKYEIELETTEFASKKIEHSIEESKKEHSRLQAQVQARENDVAALSEKLLQTQEVLIFLIP